MRLSHAFALSLAAGGLISVAGIAQVAPPAEAPMRGPMMRADVNGDGVITRAEAIAEAGARFDRMDTNHDGKLDANELARMRPMRGMHGGGDMPPPPPAPPAPAQ